MRELAAALPRSLATFPARIRLRPIQLKPSPQMRRRVVAAALIALALGALYHFWLRDSSLVAVESVEVSGLTTKDGPRIRATLESVAEDMTTLHIRVDELEEAARQFPVVGSIAVERDFPHGLRIAVTERRPVALVSVDGVPMPAASDGTLLRGVQTPAGLPLLRVEKAPVNGRVTDPSARRALLVTGAAPAPLAARIDRVSEGPERGIVVELEDGPEVVFGDADLAVEKWTAAARVLADSDAHGASYIDVRLPERPVAGGLPVETIEPVAPAGDPVAVPPANGAAVTDPTAVPPATPAEEAAGTTAPVTTPQAAPPAAATPPAAGTTGAATAPQP